MYVTLTIFCAIQIATLIKYYSYIASYRLTLRKVTILHCLHLAIAFETCTKISHVYACVHNIIVLCYIQP